MRLRLALCLAVLCSCFVSRVKAEAVSAEELLPEDTLAALIIPDLGAARAAAIKTKLGEMFSQPDMQQFIQPIQAEVEKQYAAVKARNPLIPAAADIDSALLSGELAVAICAFPSNPKKTDCVVVTFRPKDAQAFERLLPQPMRQMVISGQPLPIPSPNVRAQWLKDRLVLITEAADFPELQARLEKKAEKCLATAPSYVAAKAKFSTAAGWLYVAPQRIGDFVNALAASKRVPNSDKIKGVISALGIDKMQAIAASIGFTQTNAVMESSVILDGPPVGLSALFVPPANYAPKADAFKFAALDAPFVSTGYFNAAGVIPLIRKTLEATEPLNVDAFDGGMKMVDAMLGFDPQKDLLENIGAECVCVQTSVDTGLPLSFMPGVTYIFPAKNPAKIEECLGKLGPALEAAPPAIRMQYRMKKVVYKEKNLHYLSGLITPMPAICCIVGDRLLVGTTVNAVKRTIDQLEAKENILANKSFQDALARVTGKPFDANNLPAGLAYSRDEGSGFGSLVLCGLYYAATGGVTAALAEIPTKNQALPEEEPAEEDDEFAVLTRKHGAVKSLYGLGMAIDLGLWPDESFFRKYRMPTAGFMVVDPKGLFSRTELPAPAPNTSSSATTMLVATAGVAVVAAIAVPSLLRSRMAANQTAAAAACMAYAEAQEIYRRTDYDGDGVLEYAQSLGGDNSLLEKKKGDGDLALVDKTFAMAEGNPSQHPTPKAGYCFKVLKAQGANATGGKREYVNNGNMTLGYALVAYPATYDGTGRDTFLISNNGTIFQKDLGPETHDIVEQMTEFDPDQTWAVAE